MLNYQRVALTYSTVIGIELNRVPYVDTHAT